MFMATICEWEMGNGKWEMGESMETRYAGERLFKENGPWPYWK
jgi:hypothetical protein